MTACTWSLQGKALAVQHEECYDNFMVFKSREEIELHFYEEHPGTEVGICFESPTQQEIDRCFREEA